MENLRNEAKILRDKIQSENALIESERNTIIITLKKYCKILEGSSENLINRLRNHDTRLIDINYISELANGSEEDYNNFINSFTNAFKDVMQEARDNYEKSTSKNI